MAQLYLAGVLSVYALMGGLGGGLRALAPVLSQSGHVWLGGRQVWIPLGGGHARPDAPVSATCCMPLTVVLLCLRHSSCRGSCLDSCRVSESGTPPPVPHFCFLG